MFGSDVSVTQMSNPLHVSTWKLKVNDGREPVGIGIVGEFIDE
jgi:hypothetical protein